MIALSKVMKTYKLLSDGKRLVEMRGLMRVAR